MERHERLRERLRVGASAGMGETSAKRLSTNGAQESSGMIQRLFKQHYQKQEAPQVAETTANVQLSTLNSQLEKSDTIAKTGSVVFDNVTLDSIAKDIATYHHVVLDVQDEEAGQLRFYFVWHQDESPKTFRFLSSIISFFGKLPAN